MSNNNTEDWKKTFYSSNVYKVISSVNETVQKYRFQQSWTKQEPPSGPNRTPPPPPPPGGYRSNSYGAPPPPPPPRRPGTPPNQQPNRRQAPPYGAPQAGGSRPPQYGPRPTGAPRPPQYGAAPNQAGYRPPQGRPTPPPPPGYRPPNGPPPGPAYQPPFRNKANPAQKQAPVPKGMKEIVEKSPAPFYAVAILWLVLMLFCPLYRWFDFVIAAALSVGVFFLAKKLFPGRRTLVKIPEEPVHTGDEELDKLITDGKKYVEQMRLANIAIEDETISRQIERLEVVTQKIFDYIAAHPEKSPRIRKFMNYYLPTTLKLLNSYDRLNSQGVEGDNISATMHEIEGMMNTIVMAFEKQLDNLFEDEAMDIATDITVLEGMLKQEGLTDDQFADSKKGKEPVTEEEKTNG